MKKRSILYTLLTIFLAFQIKAFSQIKISGAECIIPGSEYQYDLFSQFKKIDSIAVCIEGGYLTATKKSCYTGITPNSIRVTWNDNIAKGKISITTSMGTVSINVRQTRPLQGGKIDSLTRRQSVRLSARPGLITCTSPKGGSCSPVYVYQWEQSDDNLRWTEIKGAVTQNLSFSTTLGHTVFLRRKIQDQTSNTIAYSDVAVIVVTN